VPSQLGIRPPRMKLEARKMVFDSAVIRHSELEQLPYFDFTKSIVVDPHIRGT